jgi:hypothetical protein
MQARLADGAATSGQMRGVVPALEYIEVIPSSFRLFSLVCTDYGQQLQGRSKAGENDLAWRKRAARPVEHGEGT